MTVAPAPIKILDREFIPDEGSHEPPNGKAEACIMEMAAYMAGERWSDHPACSSPVIGAFCRTFWDRTPRSWPGLVA